jgi:hypothetical protein
VDINLACLAWLNYSERRKNDLWCFINWLDLRSTCLLFCRSIFCATWKLICYHHLLLANSLLSSTFIASTAITLDTRYYQILIPYFLKSFIFDYRIVIDSARRYHQWLLLLACCYLRISACSRLEYPLWLILANLLDISIGIFDYGEFIVFDRLKDPSEFLFSFL